MPLINKQQYTQYFQTVLRFILKLRNVNFAGQVLFVVVVLLVSWSGVKAIDANYVLEKQIAVLQQQNTVQGLENTNLKLQNDYYNSSQYLELSARQNFGLAAPGEKEILVPGNVALLYTAAEPELPKPKAYTEPSLYQRNLQLWVDFFMHRQSSLN